MLKPRSLNVRHPSPLSSIFDDSFFGGITLFDVLLLTILLMENILHQLRGSLSHYLQGFIHPRWLAGYLPSTVVCLAAHVET